ncbi:MAG TPA: hypothetical protein VIX40_00545 [Methylomirabilota bacterium]
MKVSRPRADVWYKYELEVMTARPNITRSAFAGYGFVSYRAWRFS